MTTITMRKIKSFDPACYALAEHFMTDEPWLAQQPARTAELASHIQEAIEDWFAAQPGIVGK